MMVRGNPWIKILFKYVFTYVIIAVLVVGMLTPMYLAVLRNERENKINETYKHLKNASYKFQHEVRKLNSFLYNLRINRNLVKLSLIGDNEQLKDIYMLNIYYYIKDVLFDNQLESEIILQFVNNNVLLTSNRIFDNKEIFYEKFFQYENMTYKEWQEKLYFHKQPIWESRNVIKLNNIKYKAFTVNFYYPSASFPTVIASIVIPERTLWNLVMTDEIEQDGFVYLTDKNSNIIASYNYENMPLLSDEHVHTAYLHNKKYTIFVIENFGYDLKLIAGIPYTVYNQAVYPVKKLIALYTMIALMIAIILSIVFAYLNYTPFKSLISFVNAVRLRETPSIVNNNMISNQNVCSNVYTDIYTYVKTVIEEIVSSKETLKQAFFTIRHTYKQKILKELIYGNIVSENEKMALLEEFSFFGKNYIILLIEFEGLTEVQLRYEYKRYYESVLERIIMDNFENVCTCAFNNSLCAVIGLGRTDDYGVVKDKLINIVNEIFGDIINSNIFFGISNIYSGLEKLNNAYIEALLCVRFAKSMGRNHIIFSDEVPCMSNSNSIELSDYYLLFNSLAGGNRTEVVKFFEDLSNKLSNCIILPSRFKIVYYNIVFVLSSVAEKFHLENIEVNTEYNINAEMDKILDQLFETAMKICDAIQSQRSTRKNKLKDEILDFLSANFSQPDLCLAVIAQKFNISERYASQFIKEITGKNYTQLIEELRMQKAQRLLKETDTPITEIAKLVGYYNKNTFYKSFKRTFNMSPKEYRENFKDRLISF